MPHLCTVPQLINGQICHAAHCATTNWYHPMGGRDPHSNVFYFEIGADPIDTKLIIQKNYNLLKYILAYFS